MPKNSETVIVIGGGVTGLSCAHSLKRAGRSVRLFEARETVGGVMQTRMADGFRFEEGPNTIPASARCFREQSGELGLAGRLRPSSDESSRRYLFARGQLRALPSGPISFLFSPLLSIGAKLRVLSEPFRKLRKREDHEAEPTFEDFLEERIGKQATQTLAGAFVRGVYAAELRQLGARSAFARLWAMANENGGLIRGALALGKAKKKLPKPAPLPGPDVARSALLSFESGLCEMNAAIAAELGEFLHTGATIDAIEKTADGWRVKANGQRYDAAELVLAMPAPAAAKLLDRLAPETVSAALRTVEHAQVVVVHFGFKAEEAATLQLPGGFGFLVPPNEPSGERTPRALGILFSSKIFPGCVPTGCDSTTSIYSAPDLKGATDEEVLEIASQDLQRALALPSAPKASTRGVVRCQDVIPRYGVGHRERMQAAIAELRAACPGVHLAGNYIGGVSVEDCIKRGREIAATLIEKSTAGASQ